MSGFCILLGEEKLRANRAVNHLYTFKPSEPWRHKALRARPMTSLRGLAVPQKEKVISAGEASNNAYGRATGTRHGTATGPLGMKLKG